MHSLTLILDLAVLIETVRDHDLQLSDLTVKGGGMRTTSGVMKELPRMHHVYSGSDLHGLHWFC